MPPLWIFKVHHKSVSQDGVNVQPCYLDVFKSFESGFKVDISMKCAYIYNSSSCLQMSDMVAWVKKPVQSNLYKTTTLGTTQKWLSWTGGYLIKYLYKTTTNQVWSFSAGC